MTPAEAARAVIVGGWAAGFALIIAGWAPAYAVAVLTLVTAAAVACAWNDGALLAGTWRACKLIVQLRSSKTRSALDRT